MSKTILVTGATGNQGGATVRALVDSNSDVEILALTRNATSASAQKLANLSPNVKLVQGDLNDCTAIFAAARVITNKPIWGVYSVQTSSFSDPAPEEVQGKALIDAALSNNVQFFVYTSVDRGGAQSAETPSPVSVWSTKYRIECYLREKAKGTSMRYTIFRPAGFMEVISGNMQGRFVATMWKNNIDGKVMHLVAVKDIGIFAAKAFNSPDQYAGLEMSLVGDQPTFKEANAVFKEKFGRAMPTTYGVLASGLLLVAKQLRDTLIWTKENRVDLGLEEVRKMHPQLLDFGTWLVEESDFRKGAGRS